jgi:diguanylate cyclase (GGDEF)-like protein
MTHGRREVPRRGRAHRSAVPRRRSPVRSGAGLLTLALALAVAAFEAALASAQALWICLPTALIAVTACRGRRSAALATLVIVGAAYVPGALRTPPAGRASPLLALGVALACAAILTGVRERLEHERDALGDTALTDPLTGIANRRLLLTQAEYEIARHRRARHSFALVMLDLDGFKPLNDRFGHAAGDELLVDVASALSHAMRAQDTVARYGGDEFVVLCEDLARIDAAQPLARRLAEAVAQPVSTGERLLIVQASIGVVVEQNPATSADALVRRADAEMYRVKQRVR